MKRRNRPLSVKVTRDGVLTIEIGIDTAAAACLASPFAWQLTDPKRSGHERDPRTVFRVSNPRGLAVDVKRELLSEAEDGSTLLTNVLDEAFRKAIEDGSEFFVEIKDGGHHEHRR